MPMPIGTIIAFAGTEAPKGWFLCNGRDISKEGGKSKALREMLDTRFNRKGDAAGVKRVPDLQGNVVAGMVSISLDANLAAYQLASTGGDATVVLKEAQMPPHAHSVPQHTHPVPQHTHKIGQAVIPHQETAPVPPDPTPPNPGNSIGYITSFAGAGWGTRLVKGPYDSSLAGGGDSGPAGGGNSGLAGGVDAIDVRQPYVVLNYIICYAV